MAQTGENYLNPLDLKADEGDKNSDLLKNIVKTETSKDQNILGAAPEIDQELLETAAPPKSAFLLLMKGAFWLLLSFLVGSFIFFNSQLTDRLNFATKYFSETNLSRELSLSNGKIISLQTTANYNRYLEIKGHLDQFIYYGDLFNQNLRLQDSSTANETEKTQASEGMNSALAEMRVNFIQVRDLIFQSNTAPINDPEFEYIADGLNPEVYFNQKLKERLSTTAGPLQSNEDPEVRRSFKNLNQTISLVGVPDLQSLFLTTDFDKLTDTELADLITQINTLVENDLSIIEQIKSARIQWSNVINEIETKTREVEMTYSDTGLNDFGGIVYTSYSFDSSSQKVSIVGRLKQENTDNFSVISNLIDNLNQSEMFENAEMKSYSKNGSDEDGYTSMIQISLNLTER